VGASFTVFLRSKSRIALADRQPSLKSKTCTSIVSNSAILVSFSLVRDCVFLLSSYTANDDTFQSYSSFTTNYKAPQAYETLLVNASKIRGKAKKAYDWREPYEAALVNLVGLCQICVIVFTKLLRSNPETRCMHTKTTWPMNFAQSNQISAFSRASMNAQSQKQRRAAHLVRPARRKHCDCGGRAMLIAWCVIVLLSH
jgi:hypothetical protein